MDIKYQVGILKVKGVKMNKFFDFEFFIGLLFIVTFTTGILNIGTTIGLIFTFISLGVSPLAGFVIGIKVDEIKDIIDTKSNKQTEKQQKTTK